MTDVSDDVIAQRIGEKITNLRLERRLTRNEFAKMAGIHYVSLFQWERGKNIKGIVKFLQFCERIGVPPSEFFTDK